jgi:amidophosphoribosyltransferase
MAGVTQDDKFHDECGLFGVFGHPDAATLTYLGLYAQQHRGQESAGIVTSNESGHWVEIGMGLVADIFNEERLARLPGDMAIGHNRYSTTGESLLKNAQPLAIDYAHGPLALAHNGNLVNAHFLRTELEQKGSIFRSTMDSEVIVHLIAQSREERFVERVTEALQIVKGAFSLLLMNQYELIAVRDPWGFRPLSMGRLKDGYVFASETCAFDLIEADFIREVEPGELIHVTRDGVKSLFPFEEKGHAMCIFEFIYFSRPDSNIFGKNVYHIRKHLGKLLAEEYPVEADLVIPVPDSGVPAAMGYAEASGIHYDLGLIRNHYIGRTFIEPSQSIRHFGVKIKLNAVKDLIEGKRVVVVDDSIVRGTTCRKIIKMIRDVGAREVHMRVSCPPTQHPCFYGIDTPTRAELIASNNSIENIKRFLNADSLAYLSQDRMLSLFGTEGLNFCTACFDGNYRVRVPGMDIHQLTLFQRELEVQI